MTVLEDGSLVSDAPALLEIAERCATSAEFIGRYSCWSNGYASSRALGPSGRPLVPLLAG